MVAKLPSFLEPWAPAKANALPPYSAIFHHKYPLQPVHVLWWPALQTTSRVVFFIPGNPGLIEFYAPFLAALHSKDKTGNLAIFAQSHLGHTPKVSLPGTAQDFTFELQIQNVLKALDALKEEFGRQCQIILIGHSVGAYVVTRVLKERSKSPDISAAFLLFPTLCHIADTPNGRRLRRILRPPYPRVIAVVSRMLRLLPHFVVSRLFIEWPRAQIIVLRSLIASPNAVFAALTLAHYEMREIRDLDQSVLVENRSKIWMYFAERDDWVGEHRDEILRVFQAGSEAEDSVRIVHGHRDIPHAFCINHGEEVASQCYEWLLRV